MAEVTRTCEHCGTAHTYTVRKKKKYDVGFYCVNCRKFEQRAIRARHPEVMKGRDLKKKFDISLEEYTALYEKQSGVCAICKCSETAIRGGKVLTLAVDHSHATGKIRGLLCGNCNKGLGNLQDSSELLVAAAEYLKSF